MKKPKYLLLGWKPEILKVPFRNVSGKRPPETAITRIPGELPVLSCGDAKTVIAAAVAADCGDLLFDTSQK